MRAAGRVSSSRDTAPARPQSERHIPGEAAPSRPLTRDSAARHRPATDWKYPDKEPERADLHAVAGRRGGV